METKRSTWKDIKVWYRRYLRLFFIDYKWIILAGFAAIVLIVGILGFDEARLTSPVFQGKDLTLTDLVMLSLGLFWFQSGNLVNSPPAALDAARFLAPALTLITIALIVITSFFDHFSLFWLKHVRRCHAIVCGLGYLGPVITRSLLDMGYSVVTIEQDPENPNLESIRDMGAIVIVGSATSEETLKRAQLPRARCVFAVTGNDAVNTAIYLKSDAILGKLHRSTPCTYYIHIEDQGLFRLFGSQDLARFCSTDIIATVPPDSLKICSQPVFFNIYWQAAACLLQIHPFIPQELKDSLAVHMEIPDGPATPLKQVPDQAMLPEPPDANILVIGAGTFGESLILQAAFDWWVWFGHTKNKMRISVLDRNAIKKVALFKKQHKSLDTYVEFEPLEYEVPSVDMIEAAFLFGHNREPRFRQIYVCFANEALALTTAVHIRQLCGNADVSIVFRTIREEHFNALFKQYGTKYPVYRNLSAFPLASCDCCVDEILFHGTTENLAMSIHRNYVRQQQRAGQSRKSNRSIASWKDLSHELRQSNRRQALNFIRYLEKIGYTIKPLTDLEMPLVRFKRSEINLLAMEEHAYWLEEEKTGKYSTGMKIDPKKHSDRYYLEWDSLNEEERETDRNAVRAIPRIFAEIGWRVIKKAEKPEI